MPCRLCIALPKCETCWNLQGCPKLPDPSQPPVGRSSPYCGDMWRTYCCSTSFFSIVDTCLSCKDIARQSCAMVPRWWVLATFLRPVLSASRMQQVSDLHLKFALRRHHVWMYGRQPICSRWDYARKKKKKKKEQMTGWKYIWSALLHRVTIKKPQGKSIMSASATQRGHKNLGFS